MKFFLKLPLFFLSIFSIASCGGGDQEPPLAPCVSGLSACIAMDQIAYAKFPGNRKAVASFTFDDGGPASFSEARLFESKGLRASFYIIPSKVQDEKWEEWKALAKKGHEVGNHSLTHVLLGDPKLTDEQLDREINGAQDYIFQKIGERPQVFVFPQNYFNNRAVAVAMQHHIATRVPGYLSTGENYKVVKIGYYSDLADLNTRLTHAIDTGGWYVAEGHGMDRSGYSPIDSKILSAHLDFAVSHVNELWIDTFVNLVKYRLCKERSPFEARFSTEHSLSIFRKPSSEGDICSRALTLVIPITKSIKRDILITYSSNGVMENFFAETSPIIVDILPGETITITEQH